jgi:hypothetical protein
MLIAKSILDRVATGDVSLAFRRWVRPTVKAGGTLRTAIGVLAVDAVEPCRIEDISETDAQAAGYADLAVLVTELTRRDGQIFRIMLRLVGADPRIALRLGDTLSTEEVAAIPAKLDGFDRRSPTGAWTREVLRLIAGNEGMAAAKSAARLGVETLPLKANIRKLKELGLTESLERGYRLSPRGRAFLDAIA